MNQHYFEVFHKTSLNYYAKIILISWFKYLLAYYFYLLIKNKIRANKHIIIETFKPLDMSLFISQ